MLASAERGSLPVADLCCIHCRCQLPTSALKRAGWDLGVATMKKGEVSKLTIQADYGYGASGSPPTIPGGATLVG